MNRIKFVPVGDYKFQRIGLMKFISDVSGLWIYINSNHIESCLLITSGCPAGATEAIQEKGFSCSEVGHRRLPLTHTLNRNAPMKASRMTMARPVCSTI